MRVGLVIERMETWRGGAETSTAQYARELLARGHEVALFTASRGLSEPGVDVHTIAAPRTRARRAAGFRSAVAAALAEFPCDLAHSMTSLFGGDVYMPRSGTVAESIQGNLRVRPTAVGRDLKRLANLFNRKQRVLLAAERALLADPAALPPRIVAVSDYVARQLADYYGLGGERVATVFNAVSVPPAGEAERAEARAAVRSRWSIPPDALLLLFVAHNFKLKGLGPLLEACGELSHRRPTLDWRLMVVGRDRPGPYVHRADRLNVAGRVIFTGPSERVVQFYLASDLAVLPTFCDPCSRVVLEAVSQGTPAVTTRYNGAAEVLNAADGRPAAGAVVADPHDRAELAGAIETFLDPQRRRQAGEAAAALRDRLSMRRHADQMLAVYEQVLRLKAR